MKPLRPYLYHAYYQWILDNDNTPYLLVDAEYPQVDVPSEFVKDGKIILNLAPRSIGQYVVDDESIGFSARFQGMLREIYIPFGAAMAIYAQETGDGIMFQEEEYYEEEVYLARQQSSQAVDSGEKFAKRSATKSAVKKGSTLKLVK